MISILIADDQNIVREGIKIFLEPFDDLKVIGMAKNGKDTIAQVEILEPDILLLDVEMPQGNGIEICHQINLKFPQTKTILLSSHEEKIYIQQGIKAGAKGYLLKSAASEELERAIKLVYMGYSVFESKILQKLIRKNSPASSTEYFLKSEQIEQQVRQDDSTVSTNSPEEKLEPVAVKTNFEPDLSLNSAAKMDLDDNRYVRNLNRRRQKSSSMTINGIHIHIWNLCLAILLMIIVMAVIILSSG